MLRAAPHIRYHIAAILAAHWIQFLAQYKRWIPARGGIVFENVRKVLACHTPEPIDELKLNREVFCSDE